MNAAHVEDVNAAHTKRFCEFVQKCSNYCLADARFCGVHICCHYGNNLRCRSSVAYSKEAYDPSKCRLLESTVDSQLESTST